MLAIAYLVIGFVVTLSQGGGFVVLARGTLLTLLILVTVRLLLDIVERVLAPKAGSVVTSAGGILRPVLRVLARLIGWVSAVAGIYASWGGNVGAIINTAWGQRILGSSFSIIATLLMVVAAYEVLERFIEKHLQAKDDKEAGPSYARARTLLPMARTAATIVLAVIVGLVTLAELGVNIAPLLAGAGIVGVAVGFGSQALVKDFLTGLFIVIENTLRVGDVVSIGDKGGQVEGISLRTVRLRDWNGDLHVMPFGDITKFTNKTKDFSLCRHAGWHRL